MAYKKFKDPLVRNVFKKYPEEYKIKLLEMRELIFDVAKTLEDCGVQETLKWGEPSYLTKKGSTIRIDWKSKCPNQYSLFFKCTSLLVPTFRKLYPKEFRYAGNRELIFFLDDKIPMDKLKHCIKLALTYHLVKDSLKNNSC